MHEALRLVCEETLEARFARHLACSTSLQAGLEALGLELYIQGPARLNSVIGVCVPDGVNPDAVRVAMAQRHRVEISGSFEAPILRIGQMGEQSRAHNLFRTLHALGSSMKDCGATVDLPKGMSALEESLSRHQFAL